MILVGELLAHLDAVSMAAEVCEDFVDELERRYLLNECARLAQWCLERSDEGARHGNAYIFERIRRRALPKPKGKRQ